MGALTPMPLPANKSAPMGVETSERRCKLVTVDDIQKNLFAVLNRVPTPRTTSATEDSVSRVNVIADIRKVGDPK